MLIYILCFVNEYVTEFVFTEHLVTFWSHLSIGIINTCTPSKFVFS